MKYIAQAVIQVPKGWMVRLTKEQLARRAGVVSDPDKDGWSEVLIAHTFLAGEKFEYDGELPAHLALPQVTKAAAEKAAAEKAAAEKAAAEKAGSGGGNPT